MNKYAVMWREEATEVLRSGQPLDEMTHARLVWLARQASRTERREAKLAEARRRAEIYEWYWEAEPEAEEMSEADRLKWELEWRERAREAIEWANRPFSDVSLESEFSDAMAFEAGDLDAVAPASELSPSRRRELSDPDYCLCRYDKYAPHRRFRNAYCPEHGEGDRREAARLGVEVRQL